MPGRQRIEPKEISYEEEEKLREEFVSSLKARGWESHEIEAAKSGWDYAFDVGHDRPEDDSDAARDLADGVIEFGESGRKVWGRNPKESCADLVYEGMVAARKAQGLE